MVQVRNFPVTSRRLPQNFPVMRVMGKFWGSWHNGIWALMSREGIVTLDICVCLCVHQAVTACCISLGSEGNALCSVLSSCIVVFRFKLYN